MRYAVLVVRPQDFQINLYDTDVRITLNPTARFNLFAVKQALKLHWVNAETDFTVEKLGDEDYLITWQDDKSMFRLVPAEFASHRIFMNCGKLPS